MSPDKPDYSIYTYNDVWTLRDAYDIIVRECEHRTGLHDKHGFIESVANGRKYEILHFLQDKHRIYIDEIVLSRRYYLISKRLEAKGEDYNILRYMDLDKNQVDVKRFIKFAVSNELPFPQELVDAFMNNSAGNQKRLGAEPCNEGLPQADKSLIDNYDMPEDIKNMSVPTLRKKVKELSDEKIKWDRSIAAATKVGLLFYEKGLERPAKEEDFKAEFKRYLDDLPGTTITRIYKSLPVSPIQYKKAGYAPTKQPAAIDDEALDMIIEAAVASGLIASEAEFKDAKELEQLFTRFEFDIPPAKYLKVISGAARRVLKQYNQAQAV